MSKLLDDLIEQRRQEAMDYQKYLQKIVELTKTIANPEAGGTYPSTMNSRGKRALYDNLGKNESMAIVVDEAVRSSRQDNWRSNPFKVKKVRNAIKAALERYLIHGNTSPDQAIDIGGEGVDGYKTQSGEWLDDQAERILTLVKNQDEY